MVPGSAKPRLKSYRAAPIPHTTLADNLTAIWDRAGRSAGYSLLGTGLGAAGEATLLVGAMNSSTRESYQRHWDKFVGFCTRAKEFPLPDSSSTICRYLAFLFESGSVGGQSIRTYSAAIAAQHRHHGLADPTYSPLVTVAKAGYRALDLQRPDQGPPCRNAPVPASFTLECLHAALQSSTQKKLFQLGSVVLAFQLGCQPASLLSLQRDDLYLLPSSMQVQRRTLKGFEAGMVNRMELKIPLFGTEDLLQTLAQRLMARCISGGDWIFPATLKRSGLPSKAMTMTTINYFGKNRQKVGNFQPPLGMKLTGSSLRSGGLTAAYSVGLAIDELLRLSNHTDTKVLFRHYVDTLTLPTPAARFFFDRFTQSNADDRKSVISRVKLAIVSGTPTRFQLRLCISMTPVIILAGDWEDLLYAAFSGHCWRRVYY